MCKQFISIITLPFYTVPQHTKSNDTKNNKLNEFETQIQFLLLFLLSYITLFFVCYVNLFLLITPRKTSVSFLLITKSN